MKTRIYEPTERLRVRAAVTGTQGRLAVLPHLDLLELLPPRKRIELSQFAPSDAQAVRISGCLQRMELVAPLDAASWQVVGEACLWIGRSTAAQAAFQRAMLMDPLQVNTLHDAARAHIAAKEHDMARPLSDRLVELLPEDPAAWLLRGEVLAHLDQRVEADAAFTRAQDLDPGAARILCVRAHFLCRTDRAREGHKLAETAVRLRPILAVTHWTLGVAHQHLKRPHLALRAFENAARLDPRNLDVQRQRVRLLLSMGDDRQAEVLEILDSYEGPQDAHAELQLLRAMGLRRCGRAEEAIAILQGISAETSLRGEVYLVWGAALLDLEEPRKARKILAKGTRRTPGCASMQYYLARAHCCMNQHAMAGRSYLRAANLDPQHHSAMYCAACEFAVAGELARALQCLEAAISGHPKWRKLARDDNDFDSLRKDPEYAQRLQVLIGGSREE